MSGTETPWTGCHGVRLSPGGLAAGLGLARGQPLLDATLVAGPAGTPGDQVLWRLQGEIDLPAGPVAIDQFLTQRADGSLHLYGPGGVHLAIEPAARRLTLEGDAGPVAQQVVVTIGLPLLLHAAGVLVLHASAACRDGEAVVMTGQSGAGKSSLLVGLLDAGWQAVSEDLCAIDLRGERPVVWPGPPWVRRAGEGPVGAGVRFETPDKTAWDLESRIADEPVPVRSIVVLQAPGGARIERTVLAKAEAVAALVGHAFWIGSPDDRAAAVFGPCVRLVGAVPVATIRSPVDPGWVAPLRDRLG